MTGIVVWLPSHDAESVMGGIPAGYRAAVWTGRDELPPSADEVEVVIPPFPVQRPHMSVLAQLPKLQLIQLLSAGAEKVIPHVPPGVTLCTARGAHDFVTAEWAATVILAHLRRLPRFFAAQAEGRWDFSLTGTLYGENVLILGYGAIGSRLEQMLLPFGAVVTRVARQARDGVHGVEELPDLLPSASVVVLLVPVTPATTGLADAAFLARMRDGALLVNAARGVIVDTGALLAELTSGRLSAALYVTDPEPLPAGHALWSAPGLILTPHIAGAGGRPLERALAVARAQLVRYAAGEPLLNVVTDAGY